MGGLILGNCVDRLGELSPGSVSLTVTSPPFGTLRPQLRPLSQGDFEVVAEELYRVTKPGGIVCWHEGDQVVDRGFSLDSYRHAIHFQEIGFTVHDVLITGILGHRYANGGRYKRPPLYVFVLSKGVPEFVDLIRDRKNVHTGCEYKHNERLADGTIGYREKRFVVQEYGARTTAWFYPAGAMCGERDVQMQFPALMHEGLARDLIHSYSEENDLVLDPFSGAATTGKMAVLMYRRFVGFEVDPVYYDMGIRRLESAIEAARRERLAELAARWL